MRILMGFMLVFALGLTYGCAGALETVNKDAEAAGEAAGKVLRVPTSVSEGAAGGIKGEDGPNPYNR